MLKGWRTITFNLITIAVAGVQAVDPAILGPQGMLITVGVNTLGNMLLRLVTTTPVGTK